MLEKFKKNIAALGINENDTILLAISGGMDSMVMAYLFLKASIRFEIAHVNYMLRDEESNKDEALVRNFAEMNNIIIHVKQIDTNSYASQNKLGIQEAARNIRYGWFEYLLKNNPSLAFLATAHHKNDNAETMLFNISRGGGMAALKGISSKRGKIVRPMLFTTKEMIVEYVAEENISYKEDQSNKSTKYSRNRIRHNVIPELQKINPGLVEMLSKKNKIFQQGIAIIEETIEKQINKNVIREKHISIIPVSFIKESKYANLIIWQLVEKCNFTSNQVEEIIELCQATSGKKILSPTHQFTRDRANFILSEIDETKLPIETYEDHKSFMLNFKGKAEILDKSKIIFDNSIVEAFFDLNKIKFPITIRNWEAGDRIAPLGMGGKSKKVSDILIHQKINIVDKNKVRVLVFGKSIGWVIGIRISDHFKIDHNTSEALKISF